MMNMQPANGPGGRGGPQIMNMQPANGPGGRGGPQVMNMQPANGPGGRGGPQIMSMQPANGPGGRGGPQVMNMQPSNGPGGRGGPQVMNMQPSNGPGGRGGPQIMNMQPANGPGMRGGPQVMNMQPSNGPGGRGGPQVMNMQPSNGPGGMRGGPQVMNMQPSNGPGAMSGPGMGGPQVMNMQPSNGPGGMGGPQVMNMQPSNGPGAMSGPGMGGPQVMNMQPMNNKPQGGMGGPQVMNMQPMNNKPQGGMGGPQIMNMKPNNEPQGGASNNKPKIEAIDEEWPDPVKVEIEARELTEGRDKLLLTLLLADRSTKKVYATNDFTCLDLKKTFATKLHLWQIEFFELCVKDTKEDADRWLNPKKTLLEEQISSGTEVMMKIKYFKTPKKIIDPQAIRLYYLEVKSCIIGGSYPTPEKLAIRLAAHQVQLTYGNFVPSKHHPGFLGDALKDYLPREILQVNQPEYIESRIFQLHRDLVGKSNEEVMESYIDLAQQIQTYGSSIFLVKEKLGRTKRVGVAEDGILISTDDNPKRFDFYSFKIIGGWKQTSDGFDIEIIAPAHKVMEFEASEFKRESLIELLSAYYLFLLSVAPDDLPLVSLPMQPANLPNPKMFHKPNNALKRNLSDQIQTRLELFKDEMSTLYVFTFCSVLFLMM